MASFTIRNIKNGALVEYLGQCPGEANKQLEVTGKTQVGEIKAFAIGCFGEFWRNMTGPIGEYVFEDTEFKKQRPRRYVLGNGIRVEYL